MGRNYTCSRYCSWTSTPASRSKYAPPAAFALFAITQPRTCSWLIIILTSQRRGNIVFSSVLKKIKACGNLVHSGQQGFAVHIPLCCHNTAPPKWLLGPCNTTHIHWCCLRASGAGGDRNRCLNLHWKAVLYLLPGPFPLSVASLSYPKHREKQLKTRSYPQMQGFVPLHSLSLGISAEALSTFRIGPATALCHTVALRYTPCLAVGGHSMDRFPGCPGTQRGVSAHKQGAFTPSSPRPSHAALTTDPPTLLK